MDMRTKYLGLELPHPFMPGASPLGDSLDTVKRMEDAGAAAIVLRSLFEEQILAEASATERAIDQSSYTHAEALSYFPGADSFKLGPEQYLEQIRRVKASVAVPVIGSLNGVHPGAWLRYAKLVEEAGADAIELNVYYMATDPRISSQDIEARTVNMVKDVKARVSIPVSVKLSPFYTAAANFVNDLEGAGADGVVLFNRFYQPDIDIEELEVRRELVLSDSSVLPLRLRWLALLHAQVKGSMAVSGGVHSASDAIKAVMTGADAVQVVSCLLKRGPQYLKTLHEDMRRWMEEHEYESLEQMKGSMSLAKSPNPEAFERANYMQILLSW